MLTLFGHQIRGLRAARDNLRIQLPLIEPEFPEISGCHYGTVNLELNAQLIVNTPDHRTKPIPCHQGGGTEVFDFVRIQIEAPVNTKPIQAWLYIAHDSPNRATPHVHEVLGPFLPNVGDGRCRIQIDRNFTRYENTRYDVFVIR
jgi:hypothetical protein